MPEIGYWKYIRFTDDEPQYFGTDDDVTIVFDSADDRLEYRMKKDIRYEDDAGNEILTIQKATRTLSGFKMTGNLEVEKDHPRLILDATTGNPMILFYDAGTAKAQFGFNLAADYWVFYDIVGAAERFKIDRAKGDIIKVGDIDMGGNLLKNPKLGTDFELAGYKVTSTTPGGRIARFAALDVSPYCHVGSFSAHTFSLVSDSVRRIILFPGAVGDIKLENCVLNFNTGAGYPPVETGKTALDEYLKIKVEGAVRFLRLYS